MCTWAHDNSMTPEETQSPWDIGTQREKKPSKSVLSSHSDSDFWIMHFICINTFINSRYILYFIIPCFIVPHCIFSLHGYPLSFSEQWPSLEGRTGEKDAEKEREQRRREKLLKGKESRDEEIERLSRREKEGQRVRLIFTFHHVFSWRAWWGRGENRVSLCSGDEGWETGRKRRRKVREDR